MLSERIEKKNNIGSSVGLLGSVLIPTWLETKLSEEIVNLFYFFGDSAIVS